MNVIYIIDSFPNLSETFILREILALQKLGINIRIYSLRKPEEKPVSQDALPLTDNVTYISDLPFLKKIFAFVSTFFRHPGLMIKLDFSLLCDMFISPRFFYHRLRGAINAVTIANSAEEKPEHIHAHFAYVATDIARILAELNSCKWSVSAHAWDIFTQSDKLLKRRLASTDRIFVCSEQGLKCLESKLENGKDKITLMYHGINTAKFESRETGEYIISVGRLEEKKGFEVLFQAGKKLSDQNIRPRFLIVGNGHLKNKLETEIKDLGLDNFELSGELPFDEVKKLMAGASMLVQPSVVTKDGDQDGIPNVILEAMALGKPVITTDVGGITELIKNGNNGIIAESGNHEDLSNKIKELMEDKEMASKIGRAGMASVRERFELSRNIESIYDYFNERKYS